MVRDRMAGGAGSTPPNHRAAILKREGTEGDINPLGSPCSQRQAGASPLSSRSPQRRPISFEVLRELPNAAAPQALELIRHSWRGQ
jgi:hypothetical protein